MLAMHRSDHRALALSRLILFCLFAPLQVYFYLCPTSHYLSNFSFIRHGRCRWSSLQDYFTLLTPFVCTILQRLSWGLQYQSIDVRAQAAQMMHAVDLSWDAA